MVSKKGGAVKIELKQLKNGRIQIIAGIYTTDLLQKQVIKLGLWDSTIFDVEKLREGYNSSSEHYGDYSLFCKETKIYIVSQCDDAGNSSDLRRKRFFSQKKAKEFFDKIKIGTEWINTKTKENR